MRRPLAAPAFAAAVLSLASVAARPAAAQSGSATATAATGADTSAAPLAKAERWAAVPVGTYDRVAQVQGQSMLVVLVVVGTWDRGGERGTIAGQLRA